MKKKCIESFWRKDIDWLIEFRPSTTNYRLRYICSEYYVIRLLCPCYKQSTMEFTDQLLCCKKKQKMIWTSVYRNSIREMILYFDGDNLIHVKHNKTEVLLNIISCTVYSRIDRVWVFSTIETTDLDGILSPVSN